ncbi:MAG TPA: hypothetical protein VJ716_04565 [Gaiellaceae bacterium]|nr:hypothetical protein [Gaiellaceae bacterium]
MSSRTSTERFSAIPRRVDEAIDREELTPRQGNLLKRLIYRCGAESQTSFTLAELAEWLRGWELTLEALRLDLKALEEAGWISLGSPGPGRSAWKLTLVGAALEFNSKSGEGRCSGATLLKPDSEASQSPTADGTFSTDTDTDTDEDQENLSAAAAESNESYAAEVRAICAALPQVEPIAALLSELPDRDNLTQDVFRRELPDLTQRDVASALRRLRWRNDQTTAGERAPLRSETAYVLDYLKRLKRERAA